MKTIADSILKIAMLGSMFTLFGFIIYAFVSGNRKKKINKF